MSSQMDLNNYTNYGCPPLPPPPYFSLAQSDLSPSAPVVAEPMTERERKITQYLDQQEKIKTLFASLQKFIALNEHKVNIAVTGFSSVIFLSPLVFIPGLDIPLIILLLLLSVGSLLCAALLNADRNTPQSLSPHDVEQLQSIGSFQNIQDFNDGFSLSFFQDVAYKTMIDLQQQYAKLAIRTDELLNLSPTLESSIL